MLKPRPISGFPEWTPAQKLAEQYLLDTARYVYELYGYTPVETAAIERVEVLAAKGVVDKEIYTLGRLRQEAAAEQDWEYALHFDLTVPLARYVAQNYGSLHFPFKRYQIQKVWRGERPQEGRFREFYQADIDVLAENELPLHFDAEMPAVIAEVFSRLGLEFKIRVNHRQVLLGAYTALGVEGKDQELALREVDKLDKVGRAKVAEALAGLGLATGVIDKCLDLAQIQGRAPQVVKAIEELGLAEPRLQQGLEELCFVDAELAHLPQDSLVIDLGIVRGLDYYTGTIYETILPRHPELGSVCSGGRYEDLTGQFINRKLPGVGISIGVSRLVSHLFSSGTWDPQRHCPTEVLVILPSEEARGDCGTVAQRLRRAGIATEVFPKPINLKKQVRYADRKGIPRVLFPHKFKPEEDTVEVKTLATGEQVTVSLAQWLEQQSLAGAPPKIY